MISKKLSAVLAAAILTAAMLAQVCAARADGMDPELMQKLLSHDAKQPVTVRPLKGDDALRLTMNKDQIVRLNQDAASVIVNNPAHAEVMLDSPRLLIVMPRQPGATSFTVLNAKGETILKRDIIVTNTQPKYVRIRRMCMSNDASCAPSSYFYCPDGCYEVTPVGESANGGGSGGNIPAPQGGGYAQQQAQQQAQQPEPAGGGAVITGGGTGQPGAGGAQADTDHPVGSDNEPLTYPGQQP